jgi:uncharacterized protein YcfL
MIMKKIITKSVLSLSILVGTASATAQTINDLQAAYEEHNQYVAQMLQVFIDSPRTRDMAKAAVALQVIEIKDNTAITVAYESMILSSKGKVCKGEVADRIPAVLKGSKNGLYPVMFNPGDLQYVDIKFFRDLCVTYKETPERVSDLYLQHMTQIKKTTGGKKHSEMNR